MKAQNKNDKDLRDKLNAKTSPQNKDDSFRNQGVLQEILDNITFIKDQVYKLEKKDSSVTKDQVLIIYQL